MNMILNLGRSDQLANLEEQAQELKDIEIFTLKILDLIKGSMSSF